MISAQPIEGALHEPYAEIKQAVVDTEALLTEKRKSLEEIDKEWT